MKPLSTNIRRTGVIISTGRTGTMWLASLLDEQYDDVCALHEPRPSRALRILSNRFMCGKLSREQMARKLSAARKGLLAGVSQPIYVESNNFLHGFLDVLGEVFPEPHVLHVVRDPRRFICSWINHGVYHGFKGMVGRFFPYWLIKPELLSPDSPRRWNQMHPYHRIGWYWKVINRHLDRGAELFGPRYLRLRFEDLLDAQVGGLKKFLAWFGLPPMPACANPLERKVNASRVELCPRWDMWPQEVRQAVLDECGPLMESYGYSTADALSAGSRG